jgi:NAD+ diphosphatase
MRAPNFYAGLPLLRHSERRRDSEFLGERLARAQARLVPVWRARNLVVPGERPAAAFLPSDRLAELAANGATTAFLGELDGVSYFAVDVSARPEEELPRIAGPGAAFVDLRTVGALMSREEGGLLAYARGLMHWHARHRFCGACGAPTAPESAGHVRKCTDAACGAEHFPRTDPALIMLVVHDDHALLARQKSWPLGQHSTLAGFVEPGESLEDAVAREVEEEAGVRVSDVRYHSSQPWPFPSSIMLGFHATARSRDYAIDESELESGGWFSRDFLLATHEPERFRLPRADSISRRLIEDWLRGAA